MKINDSADYCIEYHKRIFCSTGYGDYYAIDTSKISHDDENPIVVWEHGASFDEEDLESAYEDFGELLYKSLSSVL